MKPLKNKKFATHGPMLRYPLTSEQCEVLIAFEGLGSVYALAEYFHKDVSVISRQLKKIAETAPVLEKHQGKWRLTPIGKQVVSWARDSMARVTLILQQRSTLRIGATREFAARVLSRQLPDFLGDDFQKSGPVDRDGGAWGGIPPPVRRDRLWI